MGRAGKLEIVLDYVRLADNEKAPVRAVKEGWESRRRHDSRHSGYKSRVLSGGTFVSIDAWKRKSHPRRHLRILDWRELQRNQLPLESKRMKVGLAALSQYSWQRAK